MSSEFLLQNAFNLFIVSIILEFCVMSVFSINMVKDFTDNKVGKTVKDIVIILLALIICFNVPLFRLFKNVIKLPYSLDPIISGLVLARMTILIRTIIEKIKEKSQE